MPGKPIRETILVNKPGPVCEPLTTQPVVPDNRYIGFVAGIYSGVTKLFVGHPFDTIKVRLQTAPANQFREGFRALYKAAAPPLLGWMVMDSVQLGSLHNYLLMKHYAFPWHAIVGIIAGWPVSFVTALIEHVKARLQVQYDAATKGYTSPINSVIRGLYRGLFSTMVFRSYFFFLWGSYDIMTHLDKEKRKVRIAAINFWAGGLRAQIFWTLAYPYPSDVVKPTIIPDNITNSRHKTWIDAARYVYKEALKGNNRSRAFSANAAALTMFEMVMRTLA
ncbi:mitochondrial carrier domain-containing protein [Lipomyces starkeyi]